MWTPRDSRQGYRAPSINWIFDYDPSYINSVICETGPKTSECIVWMGRHYPPACNWARKDSDDYWKRVHLISFMVANGQVSKEETSAPLKDDQRVQLSLMAPLLMEEGGPEMWVVVCFCLFLSKHRRRQRFPQLFNREENLSAIGRRRKTAKNRLKLSLLSVIFQWYHLNVSSNMKQMHK